MSRKPPSRSGPNSRNFGRRRHSPVRPRNPFRIRNPFRVRTRFSARRLARDLSVLAIIGVIVLVAAIFDDGNEPSSTVTASPSVTRIADRPAVRPISICQPQYRRGGGGVTCVTDGDSGVEAGRAWRLTSSSGGVDAPEIGRPDCSAERSAGERARNRLQNLMSGGYTMSITGTDRYDRQLVVVTLADGRDAGETLIEEGLAQPWPNSGNPWC